MTRAIIYRGPTTYSEAVNICIEVEADLLLLAGTKTTYSPTYPDIANQVKEDNTIERQNYQNKFSPKATRDLRSIRCYKCNKKGHMKKDCRSKENNSRRYQGQNDQDIQASERKVNNEDNYKESDINIFSQFLQANNSAEIEERLDLGNRRFKIHVQTKQGEEEVLIDTGSTMCSITEEDAHRLNLERYSCPAQVIRYGNSSIQTTNEKAILVFSLKGNLASTAHLYVVKNQNERIILGMDWMIKEDIVLYPGKKSIGKIQATNNNAELVERLLNENPDLTKETESQSITTAPYQHRIDTGDALPCVTRDYRRSETENQAIEKEVQEMLKKKVIVPSTSDWCSPVVLIRKPDGSFRFCVDYRGLNKITVKDKYPLPRISELLDRLHGSYYFSTIDLKSGYWQLPLDKRDTKKTAFVANGSLYEFQCMPFGVVNGPSSFMRFMHIVLRGVPRTMVYLDDIIVYSSSAQQHEEDLSRVLKRLDSYNLKISAKKCQFFKREVKFLGFLVSGEGIRSDPEKVAVIKTWPTPTTVKQLMRFLGFCAFYHKFLQDLSSTARPLYKLLRKEEEFRWSAEAEEAFQKLKSQVMHLPLLAYPNPALPYDLHCDASNYGLGAVLVQAGRPVVFASRTLTAAEQNYHTTEKECLAIVWSLDYFHPYVYGADFTIHTDHAALKSILSTKLPKGRIARWIMALQSYHFTIVHKKGTLNQDADALSRLSQNSQTPDQLTPEMFKQLQQQDPEIKVILREGVSNPDTWINGVLARKIGDTVVPRIPRSLVSMVLRQAHDEHLGGHFGVAKTMDKVKQMGWWPTIKQDVEIWVKHCEACQRRKIRTESTAAPLRPILPSYLGEIWASDVAVLTEITAALPSFDTDHVVPVLLFEVVLKIGVPSKLITDNGSNYVSVFRIGGCFNRKIK